MLGLTVDKKKYMIGLISRLTDQKGLDLVDYVFERILDDNTQFVVIGTGEERYENMFRHFAWKYGDRVSANICYDSDLAQKLYASADAFLMPSRFEPCGLTQMMAFRYGTVPIVRETGGLKDTVEPYNEYENIGTGFSFTNYNGEDMLNVINYSKTIFFERKRQWNQIVDAVWQRLLLESICRTLRGTVQLSDRIRFVLIPMVERDISDFYRNIVFAGNIAIEKL